MWLNNSSAAIQSVNAQPDKLQSGDCFDRKLYLDLSIVLSNIWSEVTTNMNMVLLLMFFAPWSNAGIRFSVMRHNWTIVSLFSAHFSFKLAEDLHSYALLHCSLIIHSRESNSKCQLLYNSRFNIIPTYQDYPKNSIQQRQRIVSLPKKNGPYKNGSNILNSKYYS